MGGGVDFIQPDHLGTPQKMTDVGQNIVWDGGASDPFMMNQLPTNPAMNQRFPGQYFDAETGLHNNYFRDYDPSLGRYIQSDPIGLAGGINTYAYAGNNPVLLKDRSGRFLVPPPVAGALIAGGGDLAWQLIRNGGRVECINWGEAGGAAFMGLFLGGGGAFIGDALGDLMAAEAAEGAGAEAAAAAAEAWAGAAEGASAAAAEATAAAAAAEGTAAAAAADGGVAAAEFAGADAGLVEGGVEATEGGGSAPEFGPFHRLGDTEDTLNAVKNSGTLKGQAPRNIYASDFPKVKAYVGPLPEGANGFEFTTPLEPASGYEYTGQAVWGAAQGATIEGDWASIPVTIVP